MQLPFTTLDVFTSTRYSGNPLALIRVPFTLRSQLTESQKQSIAREFNLSETVFLYDVSSPDQAVEDYDIFTVDSHISFAGHPTIGTALYVARHVAQYPGVKRLRTVAGFVDFEVEDGESVVRVKIPQDVHVHACRLPHPEPELCPKSLVGGNAEPTVPLVSIVKGMAFHLVPYATLEALGALTKASSLVSEADEYSGKNLDKGSGWDVGLVGSFFFVDLGMDPEVQGTRLLRTRMLAPGVEDPGTGSASGALCCWLALQEDASKKKGPFQFHLVQGVEMGRRCDIHVKVTRTEDGKGIEQVELGGGAVEVMEGVLTME